MKNPALYAVVALDAYGEQVHYETFDSEKAARQGIEVMRAWKADGYLDLARAATFHVARFEGVWL